MQLVDITRVHLPDWGWHMDDREEVAKLSASLHRLGQVQTLMVREHGEDEFEIVDGRRRLSLLKQMDYPHVWVCNLGKISKADAIKYALTLELSAEVDYAKMAVLIKSLENEEGFASLPMITPFSAERIGYFVELTDFDWSQFAAGDEQASLYDEEDAPRRPPPPPGPGPKEPPVPPRPRPATAQPQAQATNDIAARQAARAAFAQAAPIVAHTFVDTIRENALEKIAAEPAREVSIILGDDLTPPEISGWRPQEPPCLDGIDEIELDCETTGLKWWAGDRPIGISLRLPDGTKRYLPWGHRPGGNLDEAVVKRWAQRELRNKKITNANMRFDNHMMYQWGVDLEEQGCELADVQHYAALLDEYRKDFGLEFLSRDFLGQHKTGEGLDKTRMADYHASQVAGYAENDVHLVGELKKVMIPLMDEQELQKVRQLESDVIYPVCEMERNAAYVNKDKLRSFVQESGRLLDEMLSEIGREVGFQVNPDKNADLVRLFAHLGLKEPGRTEPSTKFPNGQPSFADALMEKVNHPLVQMVRRSGKLASLRQKFLKPYAEVVGADSRLRFALHQLRGDEYGTVRGRFSMSGASKGIGQFGANLQQVFRVNSQRMAFGFAHDDSSHDHEIFLVRGLFEAEPYVRADGSDTEYLSADAQSIEYRLAAHFAEAGNLISAYKADTEKLQRGELTGKWVDFHKVVGDEIRPYKDLSRNIVKNANFCLVYGGREATLARTLGVEKHESDQLYKIWHRMFPELSKLPAKAEALAKKRGYVKTILGRRARFNNEEQMMWAHAAINYVIQGSAADIMKTKLVELHKARKLTDFLMRQTVHDEVDGDARDPKTAQKVREILNRQSFNLRVPIVWEVETGPNWAVAH